MDGAPDATERDALPGAPIGMPPRVGRFDIHSLVGRGGMASVYRAFDPTLDRLVALKVLHAPASTHADDAAKQRKRILREARAAAAFTHANTVTIYEVGEADGQPFIAMELLAGTTLRDAAQGDASVAVRLRWLLEAARALAAAHERGLVHRDVKPDNMLVGVDGRLKLLDFGIAKRDYGDAEAVLDAIGLKEPEGPSSLRTVAGQQIGTPRYMAPEQLAGESTDARTDQYAWGLVAFELLAGALPAPGEDVAATLRRRGIAEPVVTAVARALAARKEDRALSLQPAIDALEQSLSARPAFPWRRGLVIVAALALVMGAIPVMRWRSQSRPLLASGPKSGCTVGPLRTVRTFAPSDLALLSDGTVLGTYDADRTDVPPSGISRASAKDGAFAPFAPFGELVKLSGVPIRSTTAAGEEVLVSLVNRTAVDSRDPDFALLSIWLRKNETKAWHRLVVQASGFAVAPLEQGFVTGMTYAYHSREPGPHPEQYAAGLVWMKEPLNPRSQPQKVERYLSPTPMDSPAVAVSASRIALVFLEGKKLTAVLVDHSLERAGDPLTVAEGSVGPPAVAYVGETLVVVWPEILSAKTRLRTSRLAAGAAAFSPSTLLVDDAVPVTAPVFTPIATGGSLLTWIRSGAEGARIRAARFTPEPSQAFELGGAGIARALASFPGPEGATIGWVDPAARSVVITDVSCSASRIP